MPVSLRSWYRAEGFVRAEAMSWSISSSSGMNGNLSSGVYCGLTHVLLLSLKKLLRYCTIFLFVELDNLAVAKYSFTS